MRSMLLLSFALLPTAALAQARTISSVAPETTMTAAISGSSAVSASVAAGEPAHLTAPRIRLHEVIRTAVDGDPVTEDLGNTVVFGHPNFETAPKLVKWSNVAVDENALSTPKASIAVSLLVDRQGNPENVRIARSNAPALNDTILSAVKDFRFEPATEEHAPVEKMMTVTVFIDRK